MNIDCDVVIAGAGISGLTTAFRLIRQGLRVEVIEAASRAGGVIGTECANGVLYERGPNSILNTSPLIGQLIDELGIASERLDMDAACSKRYIVRSGGLVALPTSPVAFLTTPLFSARAKLRLLCEPFVARGSAHVEESVAQFVSRRLGREILDYAIEPFVAGVHAGDAAALSLIAAFPRLHALEQRYGSLIQGQIRGARERSQQAERSRHSAASFSFRAGMQTLTNALARAAVSIRTGSKVLNVRRCDDGTWLVAVHANGGVAHIKSHAIVLAIPAYEAAPLVQPYAPAAARALAEIPYAPVVSVAAVYSRKNVAHPLDGFGFLAPRVERRGILGTLFSSSMFEHRSPAGKVLVTTFIGGQRDPQLAGLPDDEIMRVSTDELASLIGTRGSPRFCAVSRWPRAIPQYVLGHLERISIAHEAELAWPGLFLCASYRGGVAVGDCIKSAHACANAVFDHVAHIHRGSRG